ncbi:hypothetical protein ACLOJK_008986 [Asimina triloba]
MSLNAQYLIVVLLTFVCVVVVIYLLYFLLFAPPGLPIFTLTSATFSPLIISPSHTSSSDLTFSIQKPYNKVQYLYHSLNVSIFHTFHLIFQGSTVANFSQGPEDYEPSTIALGAAGVHLRKAVARDLIHDLGRDGGNVSFRVRVEGCVKFGWVLHRTHFITALCGDVPVGYASNTSGGLLLATQVCESRLCDSGPDAEDSSCLNAVISC